MLDTYRTVWQVRQSVAYNQVPMVGSGASMSQTRNSVSRGNTARARHASQARLETEWDEALNQALALEAERGDM